MKKILTIGLLFITAMLGGCGFETVDNGFRGVQTSFGKVDETRGSMTPDLYFYNPFTQSITEIDIRTQVYEQKLHTYTKDVQQAVIVAKVNYRPTTDMVHKLFQIVKIADVKNTLILPALEGDLKKVIGQYEAVEVIAKRGLVTEQVEKALRDSLGKNFITIERVELVNIDYTKEFEKAVEDKVVAIQNAVASVNKTKQIQEEARQTVITAEAKAQEIRIQAQALQANPKLVEYEAVKKWDGKMPQYMMGNSVPFLKLN